ncbi:hypothetical protein BGZ49_007553 [Haplosporangium sp. Z 27]|nr:hypothetical protein BGZ49_007553 [Haplosporangium sp. Z 27]
MPLSLLDEDIPLVPGPDRPMVRSFKLSGTLDSIQRFNDILFNLTSLTTLDLNWWPYSLEVKTNDMELDRILESLPNLKYLSMRGCDFESILPQSPALDSNGAMYKLRRFAFEVDLLSMPRSFLQFFRRLGNLTTIEVYGYDQWLEKIDSKAIADILKESCKKVERILTSGLVPLYLYILPPSVEVTNLVLRGDTPSGQRRIEELQRQQCEEAEEIFPRLTTFISTLSCILSAEDLRCLSVQAEFLTVVDLSKPLSDADDPYEEDDPTIDIYLQRNSGAQARHIIRSLDIQLFLENCRHLRHFGAERRTINLIDMTPPDKSKSLPEACHNSFSNGKLQVVREAKPWACEGTLERLEIGFRVFNQNPASSSNDATIKEHVDQEHHILHDEEDDDDGWQVVSSSSPASSASTKEKSRLASSDKPTLSTTSSVESSSPSPEVASDQLEPVVASSSFSSSPDVVEKVSKKKKKQIFGTDEFQPVVSKKQIARPGKVSANKLPNAPAGVSTSSYFDLLQDTEDADADEILERITLEEEEEKERELTRQEQELKEAEALAEKERIEQHDQKLKEKERLEQEQEQIRLEKQQAEAREALVKLEKEKEEAAAAAAAEAATQKQKKEDKKKEKEAKEKEIKEKEIKEKGAKEKEAKEKEAKEKEAKEKEAQLQEQQQKQVERAREEQAAKLAREAQEAEAQALRIAQEEEASKLLEEQQSQQVESEDSWQVEEHDDQEEDDEWQEQSKSKKSRKTRSSQQQSSSAALDIQSKMSIYVLQEDEVGGQASEEEDASEEGSEEEKSKLTAAKSLGKSKGAFGKNKKKKSNPASAASSPRLEGKKAKKAAIPVPAPATIVAAVAEQEQDSSLSSAEVLTPKLSKRKAKKASTSSTANVVTETSPLVPPPASIEEVTDERAATTSDKFGESSSSMVQNDGPKDMVGGVFSSIFEKGVNPGLIKAMNLVFVALFLSLGFLIFASGGNGHAIALTGIAVALFGSVQWFLREMETMRIDERKNV